MSDDEDDTAYGLVMPFMPVRSKGGPYDDEGYVAGYEMGLLDATLRCGLLPDPDVPIHATNTAQADLIAMRHGYVAHTLDSDNGWAFLTVETS